jgi:hypothetical protein
VLQARTEPPPLTPAEAVDELRAALRREADVREIVTVEQMLAPPLTAVTQNLQRRAVELDTAEAACE